MLSYAVIRGLLAMSLACAAIPFAPAIEPGQPAPDFQVRSGDHQELSLTNLAGKIVVLMYETRDTLEVNRPLKKALADWFAADASLSNRCAVAAVANCAAAHWPVVGVWERQLVAHSATEHIRIYGDWDGKLATDYGLPGDTCSVLVIDAQGIVRFRASGALREAQIATIKAWLTPPATAAP